MARFHLERELLNLRFKNYTPEVASCISRAVQLHKCQDTSDPVIDSLWNDCRRECAMMLHDGSRAKSIIEQHAGRELTPTTREKIRTYVDQARDFEAELSNLDDDAFEALYRSTTEPIVQAKRKQRLQQGLTNDRWADFNKPEAAADFDRWRERWLSPAQAVALWLGKNPDVVTCESLTPYKRIVRSPFRESFKERLDLIEAGVKAGELSLPISVNKLAQWAADLNLPLPNELTDFRLNQDAAYWKAEFDKLQQQFKYMRENPDEFDWKSRNTLYTLLLGMALDKYGYKAGIWSGGSRMIHESLKNVGLFIGEETIRNWLSEAVSTLDYMSEEVDEETEKKGLKAISVSANPKSA